MIYDLLEHADTYNQLSLRFAKAFGYLRSFDPSTPNGKIPIDGDDVVAVVQSYPPTPASERPFEAHRAFADIQFVCQGEEIIQYATLASLEETQAYQEGSDYALYRGKDAFPLFMSPGSFAILFPQDGHKPGCFWRGTAQVKKVVVKVRV